MIPLKTKYCLIVLSYLLSVNACEGMPDDRTRIMYLSANSADVNQQLHRGIYDGGVKLDQGTTHIRAARAITILDANNKLLQAVIYGNNLTRAHYWTRAVLDKPILHAYADIMYYYPKRHTIDLLGHVRVKQGLDFFAAKYMSYDTLRRHLISKSCGNEQNLIVMHPGKNP